jgi:hypothetical protein
MITVNTTDPAERDAVVSLMEQLPADLDYQVYCLGHRARRWRCPCGTMHSRGHFVAAGVHRCLACGYTGTGGVMLDGGPEPEERRG